MILHLLLLLALSHSGQAALCSNSFKSFKFSCPCPCPCPCTSTATAGTHHHHHHHHRLQKGQKQELFYCCCSTVSLRPSQAALCSIFQVIQIFLPLPLHQHSHCRHPPPQVKSMNFSTAAACLLSHSGQAALCSIQFSFKFSCPCPCTSSGQAALCSIQFSFKFSCLPLHQLRPSSTVFHSIFIQIFLLALAPAQAKQHCVPFNFHSNFLALATAPAQQPPLQAHIPFFQAPKGATGFDSQFAPLSQAKQHHFISQLLKFPIHQRGQQALIHGLTLSQAKQHHFIFQLLKFIPLMNILGQAGGDE